MLIKIGQFDVTECWNGVFYKKLSRFPDITDWEIQTVLDFIEYEKANGRSCKIEAEKEIVDAIDRYRQIYQSGVHIAPPEKIEECTACPKYKGCMTDFVCHTTSVDNAIKILDCGSLLSPVLARRMSAEKLRTERRNAANDPADYFEYIMFAWGNCQAGDRLVMERKLGRFPDENDLSIGFTPGVRFFFRYDKLIKHTDAVFEGVLPLKVKNEVVLKDWVSAIIAPTNHYQALYPHIPEELKSKVHFIPNKLKSKVHFIPNNCKDIWEWSEKVYEYVKQKNGKYE